MVTPANVALPGYLQQVASSPAGRAYKGLCADLMELEPGQHVIDLGCGPGADLPELLRRVGAAGDVVGVDLDTRALGQAGRTAPEARLLCADLARVEGVPDGWADRIKTDRVLQHVSDPAAAVAEVARMLGAGGRVVFCEPDWHSLIVDADPEASNEFRQYVTERVIRNPAVGRQLPRLSRDAGLLVDTVVTYAATLTDPSEADATLGLRRVSRRGLADGRLSPTTAAVIAGVAEAPHCLAAVSLVLTVATRA